jgi:hypothetical protein
MCEDARGAGIVVLPLNDLLDMKLEHEDWLTKYAYKK